ncbi:hypothetical protein [Nocardioides flavescens]|uniref:HTH luxR-type domain-containing protein n=1 Tax=Nocardioides flavescens TaxID=2691959 RepID=A0A6L7F041_9ACTN|nr:hypothetical protein [Nocardioides flavescens]MXG90355.1 hypothetical protein [Nocardioides flavescens]
MTSQGPLTPRVDTLTAADLELLAVLAEGRSRVAAARLLSTSPRTVSRRLDAMLRTSGASNVTHLIATAVRAGLV